MRHKVLNRNPHEWFGKDYTGHYSAMQVILKYGKPTWDAAYTFAFVRDPFTRFMSWVKYVQRDDTKKLFGQTNVELLNFVCNRTPYELFDYMVSEDKEQNLIPSLRSNIHLWPQIQFLTIGHSCNENDIVVNNLYCLENSEKNINTLCQMLNIKRKDTGVVNATNDLKYDKYYSDEEFAQSVREYYDADTKLHQRILEQETR